MSDDKIEPTLLSAFPPSDPQQILAMNHAWLTKNHYSAVGRVAANWASFEATIDSYSITLAGLPAEIIVCFTAQIPGSGRKLDALIALARIRGASSQLIKELCKFAEATHKLAERRNRAVHDPWFLESPENPQRLEITAQKKSVIEMRNVPTEQVLKLAQDILDHTTELDSLAAKVGYLPP